MSSSNMEEKNKGWCTPIMEAAATGHADVVQLLILRGANVNAVSPTGNTALMYACANGHVDAARVLLDAGAKIEEHNENGHTPLMEAASAGHVSVAKLLLSRGAGINTHSNEFKESALTLACYKGHLEMVNFLLDNGADQEHKTDEMHTALMEASMDGHVDVARLLLDSGAQVNMPTDSFESPLTLAACGGHVELAMLLLERGANIEEVNDEGYTPLMEAAREGHEEMVAALIAKGAKVNATTEETHETALTLACCGGFINVADYLIKHGADMELGASSPLMEAAQEGQLNLVKYLLEMGADVFAVTHTNDTAFTHACENGHTDIAEMLLQHGSILEHESEGGRTPLMKACRAGHLCTVQYLVEKGADVNRTTTNNDHTCLSLACSGGHFAIVQFLLDHGANVFHKLKDNSTMLIEAAKGGHTHVVQMLLDYPNSVTQTQQQVQAPPALPPNTACTVSDILKEEIENSVRQMQTRPPKCGQNFRSFKDMATTGKSNGTANGGDTTPPLLDGCADSCQRPNGPITMPCGPPLCEKHAYYAYAQQQYQPQPHQLAPQEKARESVRAMTVNETNWTLHPTDLVVERQKVIKTELDGSIVKYLNVIEERESVHEEIEQQIQQIQRNIKDQSKMTLPYSPSLADGGLYQNAVNDIRHQLNESSGVGNIQISSSSIVSSTSNIEYDPANPAAYPTLAETFMRVGLEGCVSGQFDFSAPHLDPSLESSFQDSNGMVSRQALQKIPINDRPKAKPTKKEAKQRKMLLMQAQAKEQAISGMSATQMIDEACNLVRAMTDEQRAEQLCKQLAGMKCDEETISAVYDRCMDVSAKEKKQKEAEKKAAMAEQNSPESLQQIQLLAEQKKQLELLAEQKELQFELHKQQAKLQQLQKLSAQEQEKTESRTLMSQAYHVALQEQQKTQALHLKNLSKINTQLQQQVTKNQQQLDKQQKKDSPDDSARVSPTSFFNEMISKRFGVCPAELIDSIGADDPDCDKNIDLSLFDTDDADISRVLFNDQQDTMDEFESMRLMAHAQGTAMANPDILLDGLMQSSIANKMTNGDIRQQVTAMQNQMLSRAQQYAHEIQRQHLEEQKEIAKQQQIMAVKPMQMPTKKQGHYQKVAQQQAATLIARHPSNANAKQMIAQQQMVHQQMSQQQQQQPAKPNPNQRVPAQMQMMNQKPPQQQQQQQQQQQAYQAKNAAKYAANAQQMGKARQNNYPQLSAALTDMPLPTNPKLKIRYDIQESSKFKPILDTAGIASPNIDKKKLTANNPATSNTPIMKTAKKARNSKSHAHNTKKFTDANCIGVTSMVENMNSKVDVDSETESNHDTALTLGCAGGHEELVDLLLSRGADIEHRDKKGFTPLILAATAGHDKVVDLLLNNNADIEAQSERTKDTPLSLACSGGRYEVVELLLARGANKEHRNVSDYTPLSLAASGGYVNIIKLLLSHGAEINSRTGSKLGISPLMLASMNGHTAAVKLLLDMGSDINAQIETNKNTALTLACFQGRHEVVALLLDRKANVEHRAKTGLTPLMEAASGGYVDVGRVLLDKGADVNAPPVPSSRDTALTIASDKGHHRFVELLLARNAQVEVKNKKGNSPMWLAANGGHQQVLELLFNVGANIDSQDNRKVSCLMAAFRKGHVKVIKWMVQHVHQFPSDQEMHRYIATLNTEKAADKALSDLCKECMAIILSAKDQQAIKANKYADILLEEIKNEQEQEKIKNGLLVERKKPKREKGEKGKKEADKDGLTKRQRKKNKKAEEEAKKSFVMTTDTEEEDGGELVEMVNRKMLTVAHTTDKKINEHHASVSAPPTVVAAKHKKPKDNAKGVKKSKADDQEDSVSVESFESVGKAPKVVPPPPPPNNNNTTTTTVAPTATITTTKESRRQRRESGCREQREESVEDTLNEDKDSKSRKKKKQRNKESPAPAPASGASSSSSSVINAPTAKKNSDPQVIPAAMILKSNNKEKEKKTIPASTTVAPTVNAPASATTSKPQNKKNRGTGSSDSSLSRESEAKVALNADANNNKQPTLAIGSNTEEKGGAKSKQPTMKLVYESSAHKSQKEEFAAKEKNSVYNDMDDNGGSGDGPAITGEHVPNGKQDGWKEVCRKFNQTSNSPYRGKKVSVPVNAISRVIGRGGSNINAIRTATGAHIEIEKQIKDKNGQLDKEKERVITIKGSLDATRHAHMLIAALIEDPEVDVHQLVPKPSKNTANPWEKSNSKGKISVPTATNATAKTVSNIGLFTTTVVSTTKSTIITQASVPGILSGPPPKRTTAKGTTAARIVSRSLNGDDKKITAVTSSVTVITTSNITVVTTTVCKTTMSYTSAIMTSSKAAKTTASTFAAKVAASDSTNEATIQPVPASIYVRPPPIIAAGKPPFSIPPPLGFVNITQPPPPLPPHIKAQQLAKQAEAQANAECPISVSITQPPPIIVTPNQILSQAPPSTATTTPPTSVSSPMKMNQPISSSPVVGGSTQSLPTPPTSSVSSALNVVVEPSSVLTTPPLTPNSMPCSGSTTPVAAAITSQIEYCLFNNMSSFGKVTNQWSVNEDSIEPNLNRNSFPTTAVESTSVSISISNPTFLDVTPKVDAAKAPGYRGSMVCSPNTKTGNSTVNNSPAPSTPGTSDHPPSSRPSEGHSNAARALFTDNKPSSSSFNHQQSGTNILKIASSSEDGSQFSSASSFSQPSSASTSVTMSRLNPRAPDFSAPMKVSGSSLSSSSGHIHGGQMQQQSSSLFSQSHNLGGSFISGNHQQPLGPPILPNSNMLGGGMGKYQQAQMQQQQQRNSMPPNNNQQWSNSNNGSSNNNQFMNAPMSFSQADLMNLSATALNSMTPNQAQELLASLENAKYSQNHSNNDAIPPHGSMLEKSRPLGVVQDRPWKDKPLSGQQMQMLDMDSNSWNLDQQIAFNMSQSMYGGGSRGGGSGGMQPGMGLNLHTGSMPPPSQFSRGITPLDDIRNPLLDASFQNFNGMNQNQMLSGGGLPPLGGHMGNQMNLDGNLLGNLIDVTGMDPSRGLCLSELAMPTDKPLHMNPHHGAHQPTQQPQNWPVTWNH